MGNLLSYEITQGWIMDNSGYIFNHNIMKCENTKSLAIFYKHNDEKNRILLNSFLENISRGLLLHADDKHIAFIVLKYYSTNYIIFYALYEQNIYEYLKSICDIYTFIDKEPNINQQRDSQYRHMSHAYIQSIRPSNVFAQKYLIEFIFRSLRLYDNYYLYELCKPIKAHLYDSYRINHHLFVDKLLKLLELKYNLKK